MQGSSGRPFSSAEALRFGWEKTRSNLKPLLIIGGVGAFLALLQDALTRPAGGGSHLLLIMAVRVLQAAVAMAFVRAALTLHDGRELDVTRPGELLADFLAFLLTSVLFGLIVAVGFLLLVVPGVIWGLKFGYAGFLVVDRKLDPLEALRASSDLTDGVKWPLFTFALLLLGVNLVGALALGVGLLVTIPTSLIAAAYVLRRLQARAAERAGAVPRSPGVVGPPHPGAAH